MNAATGGREEVGTVLWAALGCNVAWGIIDGCFYLFTVLINRGESLDAVHQIRFAKNDDDANEALRGALPLLISDLYRKEDYDFLRTEIKKLPEPPASAIFTWNDLFAAIKIFLLVFISTFPVVVPFIFIKDVFIATRISNSVALLLLFVTGIYFGKRTHYRPLTTGILLSGIGALLVVMTIALGG
jgi:VIT1/CCC1 family predicted Fe2+/Mn2+ transporter